MNSAYGKDLVNLELFSKIVFKNKEKTLIDQCLPTYKAARQIQPDFYAIERDSYYYSINTAVQEGFFTLDNAKVILLSFYCSFIANCLDHNRFHLVEGDTDSLYFAISGDPNAGVEQQFTHIIIDKELYDKLYYEWFPNPAFGKEDEKKLLGLAIENQGTNIIAVSCKYYCLIKADEKTVAKSKGVNVNRNNFTEECYKRCIKESIVQKGINVGFKTIKIDCTDRTYQPVKYEVEKVGLSPKILDKVIVLQDESCAPFIDGYVQKDYWWYKDNILTSYT
jgi:hypothetical protein